MAELQPILTCFAAAILSAILEFVIRFLCTALADYARCYSAQFKKNDVSISPPECSTFSLGNESTGYVLHQGGYSVTAGDCL